MRSGHHALCLSLALLCLSLAGCGEREGGLVIRLAHGLPVTHPVHEAVTFLAERVHEKSGGTMRVDVYPSEQLGTEREVLELVQVGTVGITKVSCAVMESFAPEYAVLSLPYVFRDEEHAWRVLQGPVGKDILASGEKVSLRGLCFYDAGARSFYTVDRPVREPADLRGLKIRVQESPTAQRLVNTLGGAATPISWGELYGALQQGVVDGAENNPPSFYLSRHFEVARHYSLNEHTAVPDVVLVGSRLWDSLGDEQRRWLQEAADESVALERRRWKEVSDEALAKVREAGVELIRPDRALFAEALQPMLDALRAEDPRMAELLDRIEATR